MIDYGHPKFFYFLDKIMSKVLYFHIPSITCSSCVGIITNYLQENQEDCQFEKISLVLVSKRLTVSIADDVDENKVIKQVQEKIDDIGHQSEFITPHCHTEKEHDTTWRQYLLKSLIGILLGAVIVAISIFIPGLPFWAMCLLIALSSLCTLALGASTYVKAFKNMIKTKTLTMDSLLTVSTLAVVGVTIASIFFPALPMMAEMGLFIFGFKFLGKGIEEYTKEEMIKNTAIENQAIKKVNRKVGEDWQLCDTVTLQPNDIIQVNAGDVVPVDCVKQGNADICLYKTIINGSPFPEKIKQNETILAGMRVPENSEPITLQVKEGIAHSHLAKRAEAIAAAKASQAPLEETASKILKYFIPMVFGLALISGIVIGIFFNLPLAIQCAISLLVSVCPCTLGFITPFAFHLGMQKAALHGVQFKSGAGIQKAAECDTIVFDYNGTLTQGAPAVKSFSFDQTNITKEQFWQYLYWLEKNTHHKIGQAIFVFAESNRTGINDKILKINGNHHAGISAKIDEDEILLGNAYFLAQNGIVLLQENEHTHTIYLVKNGLIVGSVIMEDPVKTDAKIAINELKKLGKTVYVATGAGENAANHIASTLNIPPENIKCHLSPEQKSHLITDLKCQGKKVAMIGDGGNDVQAMAASDFGLVVKSSLSDPDTVNDAHAVISNESLAPVVTSFVVAQQTLSSIKQNLFFSLSYNVTLALIAGGVFVAVGFAINPAIGIGLMVLQMGLLLGYQYRLKSAPMPHMAAFQRTRDLEPAKGSSYDLICERGMVPRSLGCSPQPPSVTSLSTSTSIWKKQEDDLPARTGKIVFTP